MSPVAASVRGPGARRPGRVDVAQSAQKSSSDEGLPMPRCLPFINVGTSPPGRLSEL
jgi:hypothetical protein